MSEEPIDLVIDKSTWGEGPWMTEPDRVEFVHAGLACLALRHPSYGNWCGYVAVPRDHPAYGKPYGEVDVEFHGGLTYADRCSGAICHVPAPGMPDDVWWLGGDFGHAFDLSPGRAAFERAMGWPQIEGPMREVYRDLPYVRSEIESLAHRLAAV